MEISFEGPIFFSPADEDRFFNWLYSLSAFEKVVGSGTALHLHLREPIDLDTVQQLLILFRRWCVDIAPLLPLKSPSTARFTLWDTELTEASRSFL